jgi:AhpD family alkylhydroperoxidase
VAIKPLDEENWPADVSATMHRVRVAGREPGGLYGRLAHSPEILDAWISFASSLREEPGLQRHIRELVIVRVAQLVQSGYELRQHRAMALAHGVTDEQLNGLEDRATAGLFSDREMACLALCESLVTNDSIAPDVWADIHAVLTEAEVVELIVTVGFYCMVAKVLAAFQMT